ncbi:MAG: hypothetical protein ABH951_01645 [Patescibacteria group bacterium]
MKNFWFLPVLILVAFCYLFSSPVFAQETDIENLFSENSFMFTEKAGVVQYFEPDWIKVDTLEESQPAFSYGFFPQELKEKTYVQFFKNKGFRVGTLKSSIEYFSCADYFYVYIHKNDLDGIFYVNKIQGNGGYIVPDSSGPIYLNYWSSLGFKFSEPPEFFSYMLIEQVKEFKEIVYKFIACCQATEEKLILKKMVVRIQPE